MSIALMKAAQTWPKPGILDFAVMDEDGETARLFNPNGPWEIHIIGGGETQRERFLIALSFPSRAAAEKGANLLSVVFAQIRGLQQVVPPDQEACSHDNVKAIRFQRT